VLCSRHHRCSLKHRPLSRDRILDKEEERLGAQRTGGRKEARSWRAAAADRVHCGGVVQQTAAAAIGVQGDTNPTRPCEEQGGRLPRKKGTALSWPRRGRRGLRRHSGASSYGGSKSRTAFLGTGVAAAPEPKAPAGSTDNEQDYVVGCTESSPQGKVSRLTVVPEVLRSFYVAGGQGDRRRLPDHGDRRATPHDHVAARVQ
jgi:hypothetical protein